MDTETLDRCYLEWSQVTTARTRRELRLEAELCNLLNAAKTAPQRGRKLDAAIRGAQSFVARYQGGKL